MKSIHDFISREAPNKRKVSAKTSWRLFINLAVMRFHERWDGKRKKIT